MLLPLAGVLASPTARSGSTGTASSSSSSRLSLGGAAPGGSGTGGAPVLSVVDIIKVLGSDDAVAVGGAAEGGLQRVPSRR